MAKQVGGKLKIVGWVAAGAIAGEAASPPADPCAGAVEWIQSAGEDLAKSGELLKRIGQIDESDPSSVQALSDIATSFRDLAAKLRDTPPPDATAQANYFLIAAFSAYGDAIELAANGLAERDSAKIESALGQMDTAGSLVSNATAEIEQAADACSLTLGTPIASSVAAATPTMEDE